MYLSDEAREVLYAAGLDQEVVSLENHLFTTGHLAYLPLERILESTTGRPLRSAAASPATSNSATTASGTGTAAHPVNPAPGLTPTTIERLELSLRELIAAAATSGLTRAFAELQYATIKGFGKLTDKP